MKKAKIFLLTALAAVLLILAAVCASKLRTPEDPDFHKRWIWCSNRAITGALTEQGFYYIPKTGSHLTYADLATGKSAVLCSNPGCMHEDEACDAYLHAANNLQLFTNGEYVYYFHLDGTLRRRSAIGTDEVTVGILGKEFLEEGISVEPNQHIVTGKYLYYTAQLVGTDQSEESGVISHFNQELYLGRMDLSSGKDEVLVRQPIEEGWSFQSIRLCGAQDGGALFYHSAGVQMDSKDPAALEESRKMKVYLKQWNAAGGETTVLLEKPRQEFLEVAVIDDGKLYYSDMGGNGVRPNTMVFDLSTGTDTLAWEKTVLNALGGGYGILSRDAEKPVVNLRTGETLPFTGSRMHYAQAVSANGYVTQRLVAQEDDPHSGQILVGFVPYSALADGLSDDDMQTIYSIQTSVGSGNGTVTKPTEPTEPPATQSPADFTPEGATAMKPCNPVDFIPDTHIGNDDYTLTVMHLPETVENPENLPVLK